MSKRKIEQIRVALDKQKLQSDLVERHRERLEFETENVQRLIGELEREIEEATGLSCSIGVKPARDYDEIPEGVDVDDPKTWRKGDVIECLRRTDYFTSGELYTVDEICAENSYIKVAMDDEGDQCWGSQHNFRFVRRPS